MDVSIAKIRFVTFIAVFLGITGLFLYTVRGLFAPLFYGIVFAIVLYPLVRKLRGWLGGRETISIILAILGSALGLVLAVYLLGTFLLRDAVVLADTIGDKINALSPQLTSIGNGINDSLPSAVRERIGQSDLRGQIVNLAQTAAQALLAPARQLAGNIFRIFALSLITFYATFYFLKNGKVWAEHFFRIFPLLARDEKKLSDQFLSMVRASLRIVFVMGAIQGFLGGLIFALLGIESPIFWGVVFGIVSLIPGLGHFLIWIPAAIILFLIGAPIKAVILILYGMFVMGFSDDFLRPYLIGRSVEIHPFLILIATLGGIATFGFTGLILGPVVASLTLAVWQLYEEKYVREG